MFKMFFLLTESYPNDANYWIDSSAFIEYKEESHPLDSASNLYIDMNRKNVCIASSQNGCILLRKYSDNETPTLRIQV